MEESQDENVFPIQISHSVDGWMFLPKEFNKENNAWLYECPKCGALLIVQPFTTISEEQSQDVPSSTESQHQPPQKQSSRKKEHQGAVQSVEQVPPTNQES